MADVFLSYASEDRDRILPLVAALESEGLSVWWDRNIQIGVAYDRAIETAIAQSKCVVVVWSESSVESEYVRSEVEEAVLRNILVPIVIDEVNPPLAHRRRQSARLADPLDARDVEFQKLITAVLEKVGEGSEIRPPISSVPTRPNWRRAAVIFAVVLCVSAGALYYKRDAVMMAMILNVPSFFFGEPVQQEIGFATTEDGTRIAYATSGEGPPIVQVLSVGTHLESGQSSPLYDNDGLISMSSRDNLLVRYDGRGTGLSDRNATDFSLDARLSDLEAVVDALGLEQFGILGISAGGQVSIAYAAKHPQRVTRLVLAGAPASYNFRGYGAPDPLFSEQMFDLIEVGWDRPEIPLMVADILLGPGGNELDRTFVAEMLHRGNDGAALAGFYRASASIDVSKSAQRLSVPTLVLWARDDGMVPLTAARASAAMIPGAALKIVDGGHMASSASTAATRRLALDFLAGRTLN